MKMDFLSKRIGVASLATAIVFTGNSFWSGSAPRREETLAVVETTAATQPITEPTSAPSIPTESSRAELACGEIAAGADGTHIFVYDAGKEEMIFCSTEPAEKLYPASITKVYAALVALMYLEPDTVVTAGEELRLAPTDSSRAYISRGCQLTAQMLVEAMLLPSGSDASYVLAAAAGRAIMDDISLTGSEAVAVFIQEMNRESVQLGLRNSHFTNPDGYHDDDHYMCPEDVAVVGALALKEPVVAKYMTLQQDSVRFESGESIVWYNNNQLITPTSPYYSEAAVGMKTGYTGQAGHCLLAAFREGEREIIVGIFGSAERYPRYGTAIELFAAAE